MSGTIHELFGYLSTDQSSFAKGARHDQICPFIEGQCRKHLHSGTRSGACSIKPRTGRPVITCPIRLYADGHQLLQDVSDIAFGAGAHLVAGGAARQHLRSTGDRTVAVFGKDWGGELRLPKKGGRGGYFVDWVLALLDENGDLAEFVAVEVQTIDTTGSYGRARAALLEDPPRVEVDTVGFNWENVMKRILPQLIYKGQLLQREEMCKKGLFFVSPIQVYNSMLQRLGGVDRLPRYALQPAAITFLTYDFASPPQAQAQDTPMSTGGIVPPQYAPIEAEGRHTTTVYKVQEAFNNVQLTEENVYRDAIRSAMRD